ncbi:MAG TPA: cytochrome C [Bacilli bacterium]|nr:cytochrome C [Bacilli bacterium]
MAEFDEDPDKFAAMMRGPRLDSYENLLVVVNGTEAGALMRRLDDGTNRDDGEPGNMNQYLGATDEERQENLDMLKEWVGHWTLKRANELTEEDHAQFKVLEK